MRTPRIPAKTHRSGRPFLCEVRDVDVRQLVELGFSQLQARRALEATGDTMAAAEWLFDPANQAMVAEEVDEDLAAALAACHAPSAGGGSPPEPRSAWPLYKRPG